jgi:hypothetical protein
MVKESVRTFDKKIQFDSITAVNINRDISK